MSKWIKTQYPGVRYREHKTRRNGVRKDRYFSVRYKLDGKDREEGLGWASAGWTAEKAAGELAKIKEAQRTGSGLVTLAEKREDAAEKRKAKEEARIAAEKAAVTFRQFFQDIYLPRAKETKGPQSWGREDGLFRKWIEPVIGNKPFNNISPFLLEKIKKKMIDAELSPRSVEYMLATVRQVFNVAALHGTYEGPNPVKKVSKPKKDNRRTRFLSQEEAQDLLEALAKKSLNVHDQALLSLHTGMRFGEIASLSWGCVDFGHGTITILDPKNGRTRTAFMTERVRSMLKSRGAGKHSELIFPAQGKENEPVGEVSPTFRQAVNDLGLNDEVEDSRQRVVFHTLRHTFASWLVLGGESLWTVKELMGHQTMSMTERYAHLAPDTLRRAVGSLEKRLGGERKVVSIEGGRQ